MGSRSNIRRSTCDELNYTCGGLTYVLVSTKEHRTTLERENEREGQRKKALETERVRHIVLVYLDSGHFHRNALRHGYTAGFYAILSGFHESLRLSPSLHESVCASLHLQPTLRVYFSCKPLPFLLASFPHAHSLLLLHLFVQFKYVIFFS